MNLLGIATKHCLILLLLPEVFYSDGYVRFMRTWGVPSSISSLIEGWWRLQGWFSAYVWYNLVN